jgi:hypothetical protein
MANPTDDRAILQERLQIDPRQDPRLARLPGVQPLDPRDWIRVDEAFAVQMAERERLLATRRDDVLACLPEGRAAADELLDMVLATLSGRADYAVGAEAVRRPDGVAVPIDRDDPLATVGRLVQGDYCLLAKAGAEHVLVAAVLCFPARWTLAQKIGRPLLRIHEPVAVYDEGLGARVQRLFDGVQEGRPMYRVNYLSYHDPALFQPRREEDPPLRPEGPPGYIRSEIQTIRRLPRTGAVAFGIHTFMVRREAAEGS